MTPPLYDRKWRNARVQAAREKFNEVQADHVRGVANDLDDRTMDERRDKMVAALNELCELADNALTELRSYKNARP